MSSTIASPAPSRVVVVSLWIAQVVLAVLFGMAGVMKSFWAVPDLVAAGINYAGEFPPALLRFIGCAELLGAIGIILPALTRVKPRLTSWAALGFVVIQILAIGFHAVRGELAQALPLNLMLLLPALFVLWGRTRRAPIAPRA